MPLSKNAKKGQIRLDEAMIERHLATSLPEAQAFIMAGKVVVGDQRVDKAGFLVRKGDTIRVKGQARFVSRAGEKLQGIVDLLGISSLWVGQTILDVGASTGGFTDVSLALGAKKVIALDVGTNQLAWELRQDDRVVSVEKTDIKHFKPELFPEIDLVVGDVSFTSLARLAPYLKHAAPKTGVHFLLLVKPQFELPREKVPAGGIVEDADLRFEAVRQVTHAMAEVGVKEISVTDSPLKGRRGNLEVFWFGISS